MRVVLDAVKEESDPQKREGMRHDHGAMSTGDKISMMEMRITMMEEMMAQMMGHTAEKPKPIHKHKKN